MNDKNEYQLEMLSSNLRLNIQKGEIYNGNKINLIECDYSDNQIFYLIPYDNIDLELKIEMEEKEKELHDSIMEEIGKSNIINFQNDINPEIKKILDEKNENEVLIISWPIKYITRELFKEENKNIKHVEIDITIENIENNSFYDFKQIESVYCESKWLNKFNQSSLKQIFIKEGVKNIKKTEFRTCINLEEIYIPSSVEYIEESSFENCLKINKIHSDYKWYKLFGIETFIVNSNEKILKREIFSGWKTLKVLIIPSSIKKIEKCCFEECFKLEEIEIPEGIEEIPENCFKNCFNLNTIKIPNSVITIDGTAFIGCVNLNNIICNEKIKKLFEKILIIPNNEFPINANDYFEYSNIEIL